jgi:hypothetical protein
MKRNITIFLLSGIPFGLFIGIWYSHLYGYETGMKGGILAGVFLGLLTYIILGLLHIQAVKKISNREFSSHLRIHHTRDIDLQLPYDKAYDLCIKSLGHIKKCSIQNENPSEGRIVMKTGLNWKTWGDTITFDVKRINNNQTRVTVSSRPTARTTIVDYGKNLENVEKIVSFLKNKNSVPAIHSS